MMRNVALGVSGILIAAALVPGRSDAQVAFGILGGTTVPASALADVAATGWNAGGFASFGRGDAAFKFRVEGVYHDFGKEDVASTGGAAAVNLVTRPSVFAGTTNLYFGIFEKSSIRPYAIGGIGGYYFENNAECKESSALCSNSALNDEGLWKFGVNGGFGVHVGKGSSFFIEARYHAVFGATSDAECLVSSEECSDRGTATFIPVSIGFTFRR
jgi:opacity protein-like surface antigen